MTQNKRHIASARAFIGPHFENIIIMCGLKDRGNWKEWRDDYGNELKIYKSKSIKIKEVDNISTVKDIYAKSSLDIISRNSYWGLLLSAENNYCFWFIGNDGRLRCLSYTDGTKVNIPPLLTGYNILELIAKSYTSDFGVIDNIEQLDLAHYYNKGFFCSNPLDNKDFSEIIKGITIAKR